MKRLFVVFMLMFPVPLFAVAFGAKTQWNVTTGGANTNGGAFDPGVVSPGTDESGGGGTSLSCTVQTTTTQVICAPVISSTTHGPGNFVGALTGSGCSATPVYNEELSQSGGTGTFSLSWGTAGSVCTTTMGGPLASMYAPLLATASGGAVSGNTINVQTGTYTISATPTISNPASTLLFFVGYGSSYGDGGTPPLITTATNSVTTFTPTSAIASNFTNMHFSNTAGTRGTGFTGTSSAFYFNNCVLDGFATAIISSGLTEVYNSTIENSTATGTNAQIEYSAGLTMVNSIVSGGASNGVYANLTSSTTSIINSRLNNNAAAGILVITSVLASTTLIGDNFSFNTGDGVKFLGFGASSGTVGTAIFQNNILYSNGGYGANFPTGTLPILTNNNNAYGANTPSARNNLPAGANDVTLGATPFTSSGSGDWSLNTTSNGGALLRGTGFPAYRDIGPLQHQDSATTTIVNSGYVN